MANITPTTIRALRIIEQSPGIRPERFGEQLWPDHEGWGRIGKCGAYGARRGVGMVLAAGGYLGKLRKAGLISAHGYLTPEGREALAAQESGDV